MRLREHGAGALSDAELLAILLRVGVEGANVVQLAQQLLSEFGGWDGLQRADFSEIARQVARKKNVPLNDLRKAFVEHWRKHNPENRPSGILTYDGNHFNDAGMRFVATRMLKMFK